MGITARLTEIPDLAPAPGFAHAVTVSGQVAFVSGQVALDADGQIVGIGDLAAQTEQSLRNLHRVLLSLDADWTDVVRFTWYVVDATQVQIVREVRDQFLVPALDGRPNPASTLIQVAALVRPELLIEVDAVVAVP